MKTESDTASPTKVFKPSSNRRGRVGRVGAKVANTSLSPNKKKQTAKKRPSCSVHWKFTLNNYTPEDVVALVGCFEEKCHIYVFQEEIGEECGTPHLQGVCTFYKALRPFSLLLSDRIHWKKADNPKQMADLYNYCCKESTRSGKTYLKNWKIPKPLKVIEKLRPWQEECRDILLTEPDDRHVYWNWDMHGNIGKSAFCKYMAYHHNTLVIQGGKLADIMNIIFNRDMDQCDSIIIDIPRINQNKVSYASIENIKNGMITNTKYETGVKMFNPPHVMVFANFPPEMENLSKDRWLINRLSNCSYI